MDISVFLAHFGYIAITFVAGIVVGYISKEKLEAAAKYVYKFLSSRR